MTDRRKTKPRGQRTPEAAAVDAPRGIRYVCLVRHALYDRVDSLDEKKANGLNSLGREQAALVAARLGTLPVKPDRFVSSDFRRALETAEAIGNAIGRSAELDSLLAECTPPSSRPGLDQESNPSDLTACRAALDAAWAKYFIPSPAVDVHDLLVCHGNVIRWFVNRALGNDVRHWSSLDIGNASLTVITVRPDGTTRLVMFSDVGHLPVSKQSWVGKGAGWSSPNE